MRSREDLGQACDLHEVITPFSALLAARKGALESRLMAPRGCSRLHDGPREDRDRHLGEPVAPEEKERPIMGLRDRGEQRTESCSIILDLGQNPATGVADVE